MKVIRELTENKGIAIALGFFDGMHIGHKKVIQTLVTKAKEQKLKSAVITFDTNPADYFNKDSVPSILTFKDKEAVVASLGVDYMYELDFKQIKDLSAQEYLETLKDYFDPKLIVVGYNHTFGKDKIGNGKFLSEQSLKYNYDLTVVPEVRYNDKEEVSSTAIRKRIKHGHLNAVKALMGRTYTISNSVIKGNQVARTLGYPTANIIWPDSMAKLPYGVYYGFCSGADSGLIPALISWGTRPTLTSGGNEILEAHLFKFQGNLYGKVIKILFVKKAREQLNFGNIKELGAQINKDYTEFMKWVRASRLS